jgi:hypothetical protein
MKVLFSILVVLICTGIVYARDVTLLWDPVTSDGVNGYMIYVGADSGIYPDPGIDVGNVTTYVVTGLEENKQYYFVATAYNRRSITNGGSAVDFGNGTVGIPCVGHLMAGYNPRFYNTTNYSNTTYYVDPGSPNDQMNITATYVSETFGSDDIALVESGYSNEVCTCTLGPATITGITISPGVVFK